MAESKENEMRREEQVTGAPRRKGWVKRLWPVAALAVIAALAFGLGLDEYLTFEALKENRQILLDFVAEQGVLAVLIYIVIYAAATAVSLPGGLILSIAGGFLFGAWVGTLAVVIAATIGATAIFLIAKTAFGDALRAKAGPFLQKMETGFQENAFSYLMVLRLIPLFPFFVVNLVPAFLGVPLRTYVLATFIGIIPGTFVFVFTGAGLGSVFEKNEEFSVAGILTTEIILALVGLALLSMLPVVYKMIKSRKDKSNAVD